MAKDLDKELGFEPISDDELGFEVGPSALDEQYSAPESALKGAEQGLTFSFADELSGLMGAGLEGAANKPEAGQSKQEQLLQAYKEYRDLARERYKQAEEQHPTASLAGSLVGGALIPGGMIAKEASLGQKMMTGAKLGAAGGALYGAGQAENVMEIPSESAQGAILGAGLGAGLPTIGAGIKKATTAASELPLAKDIIEAYKYHKKGVNLRGPVENVVAEAQQLGREMEDTAINAFKQKAAEKTQNLEKVNDKLINIKDKLTALKEKAKELPSTLDEEKQMKDKLLAMLDEKLEGIKEVERVTKEVPIAGSERSMLEKAELEKAKDLIARKGATEDQISQSNNPEIAEMLKQGMSPEEIMGAIQGSIKTDIIPTEFPNLQAGVISRELPGGKTMPLSSMPIRLGEEAPQTKTVTERILRQGEPQTEMTPKQLDKFISDLTELTPIQQQGTKARDAARLALEGKQELTQALEEMVPQYGLDKKEISDIMSLYEAMTGKPITDIKSLKEHEQINKQLGDLIKNIEIKPEDKLKLEKIVSKGIQRSSEPTDISEALSTFDYKKAKEFMPKAEDISKRYDLMRKLNKEIQSVSEKSILGPIQSLGTRLGTHAGDISRSIEQAPTKLAEKSADFIMNSTPEQLKPLSQKMLTSSKEGAKELGTLLDKISNETNTRKQKALLFGIMQNPTYRQLLKDEENEPTK